MHELSIAESLIDAASDAVSEHGGVRATRIKIRIGLLSGIVQEALRFSFDLASSGTPCDGALLDIEIVPITVSCSHCNAAQTLTDSFRFSCPTCGQPTPDVLSGKDLELTSIEISYQSETNA
ncbi:MAG TPA: hydrogenase maturation nickel metallochaperone HypA [Pirellulales bacterium]|jgi:hydrogenase nickel incorporation protein HypA/HybF